MDSIFSFFLYSHFRTNILPQSALNFIPFRNSLIETESKLTLATPTSFEYKHFARQSMAVFSHLTKGKSVSQTLVPKYKFYLYNFVLLRMRTNLITKFRYLTNSL